MRIGKDLLKAVDSIKMRNDQTCLKMPLIEICGFHRALIENHIGILVYTQEKICVKVRLGVIIVTGNNLLLRKISKDQLVICGKITGMILERG